MSSLFIPQRRPYVDPRLLWALAQPLIAMQFHEVRVPIKDEYADMPALIDDKPLRPRSKL
jgi:hypothetical protein